MPLPTPANDITALQQIKMIAHLTADATFAPLVNLPILPYPPDGLPPTHPERCCSLWYLDSDVGYADNATNENANIFCVRVQIKEASELLVDIQAAHRVAQNIKDILVQALWRYKKDDCSAPPALWRGLRFASPSARVYRDREKQLQIVEVSYKVISTHPNRPI